MRKVLVELLVSQTHAEAASRLVRRGSAATTTRERRGAAAVGEFFRFLGHPCRPFRKGPQQC